jgi:hypothetical protein
MTYTLRSGIFYCLSLLAFLFITTNTHASHVAGADLEYTNIGFRQWKIKLTFYRFCDGISVIGNRSVKVRPSPSTMQNGLNTPFCNRHAEINVPMVLTNVVKDVEQYKINRCGVAGKNV